MLLYSSKLMISCIKPHVLKLQERISKAKRRNRNLTRRYGSRNNSGLGFVNRSIKLRDAKNNYLKPRDYNSNDGVIYGKKKLSQKKRL